MSEVIRIGWFSGRGSIATGVVILLLIPAACRVRDSNSVKDANQVAAVSRYETRFEALKRRQFRIQADISGARADIQAAERRRDVAVAKLLPASTELGETLRVIKRMEEDLAAAKKRQVGIQQQLARMAALEKKVAAATKLAAELAAVDGEIAAGRNALKQKMAVLAGLRLTLTGLTDLEARVRKQIGGTAATPSAKKAPPKKKAPSKKAPRKQRPQ